MLLENLIKKVDVCKKTVENSDEVILASDEHIDKSDKPREQSDMSFIN